jgi:xanthine dehydrogenase accessory factor
MATHRLKSEICQAVVDFIDAGRPFALAVVLRGLGSTPRKAGTKAIIDASGSIWGTIGGGLLESEAQRQALVAIESRRPVVFDFEFTGSNACGGDPVCGGTMRILVDPTAACHRAMYAAAAELLRSRRRGMLVTTISEHAHGPLVQVNLLKGDAAACSEIAGGEPQFFVKLERNDKADSFASPSSRVEGAGVDVLPSDRRVEGLAEPLIPTPLLIIAGGGHVGQALAEQARLVGFDILVVEDRAQFADPALYPVDVTTRRGMLAELQEEFPVTQDTYIAIVGRGHLADAANLATCIDTPAAYIGMLGSRRKIALLRQHFIESGKATAEQFDRVHAPIGLRIGAETVPEIAASIVAQLVAVRRQRLTHT